MVLVDIIFKWQTLIGGILGGLFALGAALVVAGVARRREELISAYILIKDLKTIKTSYEAIEKVFVTNNIDEKEYTTRLSEILVVSYPNISEFFEASASRLMPINDVLTTHLMLFTTLNMEIKVLLARLREDYNYIHNHNKSLRPKNNIDSDVRNLQRYFDGIVKHARCSETLISNLILNKIPTFNRLRYKLCMNKKEKNCLELLTSKDSQYNLSNVPKTIQKEN